MSNNINRPKHYTSHPSGVECIDIIVNFPFGLGCIIKYLWRAGLKNSNSRVEDLQKAMYYMKKAPLYCVDTVRHDLIQRVLEHENNEVLQKILKKISLGSHSIYMTEELIEILQRQINDLQIEEDE